MTNLQRGIITAAAVVFLVLVAAGVSLWGLGIWNAHQDQQRRQNLHAQREPICTEVFSEAKDDIEMHSVAASQRFFALTRSTAAELAQSDPGFSEALQRINLTTDGLHALDAYC